jgi:hypothetical protein
MMGDTPSTAKRRDGRRILVSTNCIGGEIATALSAIFPDDVISAVGQINANEEDSIVEGFAERLRKSDVWVRFFAVESLVTHPIIGPIVQDMRTIDIPHLNFHAFHPDLLYGRRSSGEYVRPLVNSGIVMWAYRRGLDPTGAKQLFNAEAFDGLGYLSCWDACVAALKQHFDHCGLDFRRFFSCVKRMGTFMHTDNHPRVEACVAFAKAIAMKLGAPQQTWEREINITDHLAEFVKWPVYPEIGRQLSVPASYDWVFRGQHFTLDDFINNSYQLWAEAGIERNDIELHGTEEMRKRFDQVLGNQVNGVK